MSGDKYRLLSDFDPIPLFIVDEDSGRILDANSEAETLYQYARRELLDMSFWKLFDIDEAVRLWKEIYRFSYGKRIFVPKLWARKKDGTNFFIHLHARRGRLVDSKGVDFGETLFARTVDITEHLRGEAEIIQASKLATLGQVAMGIAHEINQPLNVLQVGADFLSKSINRGQDVSDEQLLKTSQNITEQVERAVRIIKHLRNFGRKTDFELYPVHLNEPIQDVFTILGRQLEVHNIDVTLDLDDDLPEILSDKNRLEQVFLNLVINARDAMEEKGPGEKKQLAISTLQEGDRVVVTVTDTGKGMPPHIQNRIFAPFFTTKAVGKGTGLGLSICCNLIKDFGGSIEVESTIDVGTSFRITFPSLKEKSRSTNTHP